MKIAGLLDSLIEKKAFELDFCNNWAQGSASDYCFANGHFVKLPSA